MRWYKIEVGDRVFDATNNHAALNVEFDIETLDADQGLGAAMRLEHKIHAMMGRTIAATFDRGGPHYRELRELFHVLHMAYHEGKKLFEIFSTRTSNDCDGLDDCTRTYARQRSRHLFEALNRR